MTKGLDMTIKFKWRNRKGKYVGWCLESYNAEEWNEAKWMKWMDETKQVLISGHGEDFRYDRETKDCILWRHKLIGTNKYNWSAR